MFGAFRSTRKNKKPKQEMRTVIERDSLDRGFRLETDRNMDTLRVQRGLRHNLALAVDVIHEMRGDALVYREKKVNNRVGK